MNGKRAPQHSYRVGTGATSLLMILIILVMTIMSVLAYSASRSEQGLLERSIGVSDGIRQAQNQAWQTVAAVDSLLLSVRSEAADETLDGAEICEKLAQCDGLPEGVTAEDGEVSFTEEISDSLRLEVSLQVKGTDTSKRYGISAFRLVSGPEDSLDEPDYLDVWKGEE